MAADEHLLTDEGLASACDEIAASADRYHDSLTADFLALLRRARAARLAAMVDGERLVSIHRMLGWGVTAGYRHDVTFLLKALEVAHHALQARACDDEALEAAAIVGESRGRKEALAGAVECECLHCVRRSDRENCPACHGSGRVLVLPAPAKEGS